MNKKTTLTAIMAEDNMNIVRNARNFSGDAERLIIQNCIEQARQTGKRGDKIILVINPLYIHIPSWQRNLTLSRARAIGDNYITPKWELPKAYCSNGKLYVADGMHRIYGAFLANIEAVTVEFMEISEIEAINIFLDQSADRQRMSPASMINAAIAGHKKEWTEMQQICHENGVNIKGDNEQIENAVGTLTVISDAVNMCRLMPYRFDEILKLIKELQWGEGAYGAKIIRNINMLFTYHGTERTKNTLLLKCKGREYFKNNIITQSQYAIFDSLSKIVATTKQAEIVKFQKKQKAEAKANNLTEALKVAVEK